MLSASLSVRPAASSDIAFLCSVRRSAMDPHLNDAGVAVSDQRNLELILWRFDCVSVIQLQPSGAEAGYFKLVRDHPTWYLAQMAIDPQHQGCGIGANIIGQIIEDARRANASVSLSVYKNNKIAISLYGSFGFLRIGENEKEHLMEWIAASNA